MKLFAFALVSLSLALVSQSSISFAAGHAHHTAQHTADEKTIMVHHGKLMLGIGTRPAALHAMVMNKSTANIRLIAAQSPSFERLELHTHETANGMMRMVQVDGYDIAAGATLKMQHGGDHLMGFGYKGKNGDAVEVTLRFNNGTQAMFTVTAEARQKHKGHNSGMQQGHHGH